MQRVILSPMVKNLNISFLISSMFPNWFPSPGQYYYPPGQPQPQPTGNGSLLPQARPSYMVYNLSTSPEFQHQANAGQMLMVLQQTTPLCTDFHSSNPNSNMFMFSNQMQHQFKALLPFRLSLQPNLWLQWHLWHPQLFPLLLQILNKIMKHHHLLLRRTNQVAKNKG